MYYTQSERYIPARFIWPVAGCFCRKAGNLQCTLVCAYKKTNSVLNTPQKADTGKERDKGGVTARKNKLSSGVVRHAR